MATGERAQPVGADAGLALLGDDHVLVGIGVAEGAGDGTAVAAGTDDERRPDLLPVRVDRDPVGVRADVAHPEAFAHVRPGARGSAEKERVELRAHDAVAHRLVPAGRVLAAVDADGDRCEGLDRVRVVARLELEVGERAARHPAGAELDAREGGGVEDEHASSGTREAPGDAASRKTRSCRSRMARPRAVE